ncbi:hypothetical protein ACN38_g5915 [Penicillium nordicum]|uniref:Uncharacterized protein n=1 Tax=Penicillium nordicum TaxID=229535 RepID=A0A0M8P480_9EURO|nr:hypothetical protein ACN38_g5915 [Penicillium nordicum]
MSLSMVYVSHNASVQCRMSMTRNPFLLMESTSSRMPPKWMHALLLLFGILLLSLSRPELDRELEVPHPRIQNPEVRYGRQSSIMGLKHQTPPILAALL